MKKNLLQPISKLQYRVISLLRKEISTQFDLLVNFKVTKQPQTFLFF